MSDVVNHPSHYTQAGVPLEPIDVIRWAPFDLGNCLKYILRAGHKGDALTDWKKAQRYLRWAEESHVMHPAYYEWFLHTHGLYLRKFDAFKQLDTEYTSLFFSGLDARIMYNIARLENEK